jgi:hypothetical protein
MVNQQIILRSRSARSPSRPVVLSTRKRDKVIQISATGIGSYRRVLQQAVSGDYPRKGIPK